MRKDKGLSDGHCSFLFEMNLTLMTKIRYLEVKRKFQVSLRKDPSSYLARTEIPVDWRALLSPPAAQGGASASAPSYGTWRGLRIGPCCCADRRRRCTSSSRTYVARNPTANCPRPSAIDCNPIAIPVTGVLPRPMSICIMAWLNFHCASCVGLSAIVLSIEPAGDVRAGG